MSQAIIALPVRVKPGSRRDHVGGRYEGPEGEALKIEVRAAASDGAATVAARRALAQALGVPAAQVSLRFGRTSRNKVFVISAPPPDLDARIGRLKERRPAWAHGSND